MTHFHLSTHDDKKVLGVLLNREDSGKRHTDSVEDFRIKSTWEVPKWVEERISGELDSTKDILKSKPKSGGILILTTRLVMRHGPYITSCHISKLC